MTPESHCHSRGITEDWLPQVYPGFCKAGADAGILQKELRQCVGVVQATSGEKPPVPAGFPGVRQKLKQSVM